MYLLFSPLFFYVLRIWCSSEKKPKQIWQQRANSSNNVARKKTYGLTCSLNQNMDKLHLNAEVFCPPHPSFSDGFFDHLFLLDLFHAVSPLNVFFYQFNFDVANAENMEQKCEKSRISKCIWPMDSKPCF